MKRKTAASEPDPRAIAATGLLAYCRPGFEGECAQELTAYAALHALTGFARAERNRGFAELVGTGDTTMDARATTNAWRALVFARQALGIIGRADAMPRNDRLAALLAIIEQPAMRWCDAWIEAPDSNDGRELAALCRALKEKLTEP